MAKNSLDKVMRHIRMVAAVHAYRGLPDRELLAEDSWDTMESWNQLAGSFYDRSSHLPTH